MIYFDTDVLVNYCVEQEVAKHQQAIQLVEQAIIDGLFFYIYFIAFIAQRTGLCID